MNITPERIAVVRLDNLGDHVLGAGLLTALRAAFPAARIVQVAPAGVADLYARCPLLNHMLVVPGREQYLQDTERLSGVLRELAAGEKFDLVINPRYAEDWYLAGAMCGALTAPAGRSIGFRQDTTAYQGYDPNSFYTQLIEAPADLHASRYSGVLLKHLGVELPAEPVVWFSKEDSAFVKERYALDREPYVVVGCGASFAYKLPALPLFTHVAQQLVSRWQRRVILVGAATDQPLATAIIDASPGGRVSSTVGELKLYQLSALLSDAGLYVGPDSGPIHMAAATGIPVIELGWVPSGYPRSSRGTGTGGWCWSPWSGRAITVHPDTSGFLTRSRSPIYASLRVDDIAPAAIDDALQSLLGRAPDPSPVQVPEDYPSRILTLEQDGQTVNLTAPPEHQLDHHRAMHPLYDRQLPRVARAVEQLAPGELFIDIGANIGDTVALLRLAGCHNPILAVEPSSRFAAFAKANTTNFPKVELRQVFVGPAGTNLALNEQGGTASSVQGAVQNGTPVPTVALRSLSAQRTALVKTDTDGFDVAVLASGLEFLKAEQPLIWAEAEVRTPNSVMEWMQLLEALSVTHRHVIAFDNFGFPVVYGGLAATLPTLRTVLEYCRRHRVVPSARGGEPRIYYLDIALFPQRLVEVYHSTVARLELEWA